MRSPYDLSAARKTRSQVEILREKVQNQQKEIDSLKMQVEILVTQVNTMYQSFHDDGK